MTEAGMEMDFRGFCEFSLPVPAGPRRRLFENLLVVELGSTNSRMLINGKRCILMRTLGLKPSAVENRPAVFGTAFHDFPISGAVCRPIRKGRTEDMEFLCAFLKNLSDMAMVRLGFFRRFLTVRLILVLPEPMPDDEKAMLIRFAETCGADKM